MSNSTMNSFLIFERKWLQENDEDLDYFEEISPSDCPLKRKTISNISSYYEGRPSKRRRYFDKLKATPNIQGVKRRTELDTFLDIHDYHSQSKKIKIDDQLIFSVESKISVKKSMTVPCVSICPWRMKRWLPNHAAASMSSLKYIAKRCFQLTRFDRELPSKNLKQFGSRFIADDDDAPNRHRRIRTVLVSRAKYMHVKAAQPPIAQVKKGQKKEST